MAIMKAILENNELLKPPKVGDVIEGKIISKKATAIYLDLGIFGTGIIYGQEFKKAKKELKNLKIGDKILGKIIDLENEEGFIELSISGAKEQVVFDLLKKKKSSGEKIIVKILGASKGGLLTKVFGIDGFLPVSQLSPEHYPNVGEGEQEKILEELKKFVGKEMEVKILGIIEKDGQVILSEKLAKSEEEEIKNFKVGDVVEGEVSGITDFGIFLKLGKKLEGMVPLAGGNSDFNFKIGGKVKAKIVSIVDGKILLTLTL